MSASAAIIFCALSGIWAPRQSNEASAKGPTDGPGSSMADDIAGSVDLENQEVIMKRFITFGEIMLRSSRRAMSGCCKDGLKPPRRRRAMAVSLANYGLMPRLSCCPDNPAHRRACAAAQLWRGHRPGGAGGGGRRYYLKARRCAAAQGHIRPGGQRHRPTGRAIAGTVFDGASWFHITGIRPPSAKAQPTCPARR